MVKRVKIVTMEIHCLGREQELQEVQSTHLEERLKAIKDLMEDQVMKIVGLEEEVTVLRSRKACTFGETTMSTSGSGSQEDALRLEYVEDEGAPSVTFSHGSWAMQCDEMAMGHRSCNCCTMHCTTHDPWRFNYWTTHGRWESIVHESWVVQ